MKRTQIYLDEGQRGELQRRAASRATTASKLIREAIDQYLSEPDDRDEQLTRYRAAVEGAFGAAPYLARGADYVGELRRADHRRDAELRHERR